ncbi:DUF2642 domain-containing protein [Effusibacillus consociatus]|uniref:DUF2642 domain-containing protein n=1 Tax=Effusibacillus consociatus TaxID=1117041 RepID=A0ABV9Q3R8_9BACL
MNLLIGSYIGMVVDIEISGDKKHLGTVIDIGSDLIVICTNNKYLYIPITHIQRIELSPNQSDQSLPPSQSLLKNKEQISFPQMLNHAKGGFVEIFVTGNQSLYGFIINVLDDYLVFDSLGYKTILIPLYHLKWLSPCPPNGQGTPVQPSGSVLSRTLEEQLKRSEGKIVILDMGSSANKIGLMKKIENRVMELEMFNGKKVYWNLHHIKTVQFPE